MKRLRCPFTLPDDAPFTIAVKQSFEYIDVIFMGPSSGIKKRMVTKQVSVTSRSWFLI